MKLSNFLIIALLGSFFMIAACNNKKEDPATEQTTVSPDGNVGAQDPSATAGTQVSSGFHYICPKNCEGGGGPSQGKCPVCGTDMVHNSGFHNQSPSTTPGSSPETPIKVDPTNTTGTTTQTAQPPAAQNAQGVWHFTCSKGCEGGAGSAGNCAKCGNPLTHNAAFHQQ